ncbi:MAG: amidohydrolase family protein, partial [Thermodesulfobacteriota bacterium]|nr:amidohydrolase family protein [Thermodesulfobacteriota bacterium]
ELAHLAELGQRKTPKNFAEWIKSLLALREEKSGHGDFSKAQALLDSLYRSGVGLAVDVGNLPESRGISAGSLVQISFFWEMLGLSRHAAEQNLQQLVHLERENEDVACTAHAPYSTAANLLQDLKKRAGEKKQLFPIHAAESADELEFLQNGSGPLRDFVEEKGVWDGSFTPPGCPSIEYLDRLGVLDYLTLCVHCVHLSDKEIELLYLRQAKVCLCPGSNRYMGVGKAPLEKILAHNILPALGTDSPGSNPCCSIWQEMRVLCQDHPGIDPAMVFTMATRGGAQALGKAEYGALHSGKAARFLAVKYDIGKEREIFDFLTRIGSQVKIEWLE